jgi:hypothetical protein
LHKALGTLTILSIGVPMLFRGQGLKKRWGETRYFSFDNHGPATNPQIHAPSPEAATNNGRVLDWFRSVTGFETKTTEEKRVCPPYPGGNIT